MHRYINITITWIYIKWVYDSLFLCVLNVPLKWWDFWAVYKHVNAIQYGFLMFSWPKISFYQKMVRNPSESFCGGFYLWALNGLIMIYYIDNIYKLVFGWVLPLDFRLGALMLKWYTKCVSNYIRTGCSWDKRCATWQVGDWKKFLSRGYVTV